MDSCQRRYICAHHCIPNIIIFKILRQLLRILQNLYASVEQDIKPAHVTIVVGPSPPDLDQSINVAVG